MYSVLHTIHGSYFIQIWSAYFFMIKVIYTSSKKRKSTNKVWTISGEEGLPIVYLTNTFLKKYNIKSRFIFIKFGSWLQKFSVYIDNSLSENEIGLIKNNHSFNIPGNLFLNLKVERDVLHIGPYIGLIVKKKMERLSVDTLNHYKMLYRLHEMKGYHIIFCCIDSIDLMNKEITGFYCMPNEKENTSRWVKGTFPFPDCVFKKIRIPEKIELELRKSTDERLFNTNFFTKFEFWEACSKHKEVRSILPETKRFRLIGDLREMLYKFGTVYLKPAKGMQGNGIFVIKEEQDGISIINKRKDKKTFPSLFEVMEELKKILPNKIYLLQQGIPSVYRNKHFDFRLYFQKDAQKNWVCQGTIGRVAQENSIVTNLDHLAHIATGEKALQIIYKVDDEQARRIINRTIKACKAICQILDYNLGHFGDIALDVIIDQDFKPWVLEVNNLYGKKSLYIMKNEELISTLYKTPLTYAAALSGF